MLIVYSTMTRDAGLCRGSLDESQLNSLRMQLDPRFLFNALNTISSHDERDPKLSRCSH
ncbi:MAG: histidine kinase [Terracidiphilus sp.]